MFWTKPKRDLAAKVATAKNTKAESDGKAAAAKQNDLDMLRAKRRLVMFSFTTVLGMLVSVLFGLYFISSIVVLDDGQAPPVPWVDVLVTGLIVGGGSA